MISQTASCFFFFYIYPRAIWEKSKDQLLKSQISLVYIRSQKMHCSFVTSSCYLISSCCYCHLCVILIGAQSLFSECVVCGIENTALPWR